MRGAVELVATGRNCKIDVLLPVLPKYAVKKHSVANLEDY